MIERQEFDILCTVSQSQMTNAKPRYQQVAEMFEEAANVEDETESPLRKVYPPADSSSKIKLIQTDSAGK